MTTKFKFLKILTLILCFLILNCAKSFAFGAKSISKALNNTDLDGESIISISVKDNKTGNLVYSKNKNLYLNPASVLKVFTMAAALDVLHEDYNFETAIYLDKSQNLYLKLAADPLLKTEDLDTLIKALKTAYRGKIRNFYIDDTVIDKKHYPDGWTVDDFWPNSPQISPYIIDDNVVDIFLSIVRDKNHKFVQINQKDLYRFSFINELQISDNTNILPSLNYGTNSSIVTLKGDISEDTVKSIPVLNTEQFFALKLRNVLNKNRVFYTKSFYHKKVPSDAKKIASFKRPIGEVLTYVLKTSNNFASEIVFKVAASKWARESNEYIKNAYLKDNEEFELNNSNGSFENAKEMFFDFYKNAGLDMEKVKLADASGVSRYNALSTLWIVDALRYLDNHSSIKNYMITANEGTLAKRMRDLSGNLKAKTGTLFGISSLAGYITSFNKTGYSFAIITQSYSARPSVVKGLEDDIVRRIYFLK